MEWALWYFAADVWLWKQLQAGGFIWPMVLTLGSIVLNVAMAILIFVLLIYAGKSIIGRMTRGKGVLRLAGVRLQVALARKEENGRRTGEYMEKWRHYKYLAIFLINIIPFVPWITGGTICYAVVVRDGKMFLAILAGLTAKVATMGALAQLIRMLVGLLDKG